MLRVQVRFCELTKLTWVQTNVFVTLRDPDTFTQVSYLICKLFKYSVFSKHFPAAVQKSTFEIDWKVKMSVVTCERAIPASGGYNEDPAAPVA